MPWLNAAILLALYAGHCELMVAWVNRVHGLPWPRRRLRRLRLVHDLLILGFPPLVLWRLGFGGARLLRGGTWSDLPAWWTAYLLLCSVGFVSLVLCAVRYQMRRRPEVVQSETVDVAAVLGAAPAGPGLMGRIARLPFNQVFDLEINEKQYLLPGLPPELDGLTIAHITDVHFRGPVGRAYFEYACQRAAGFAADLVLFTGDLIDEPACLEWLPTTLGKLSAPLGCWFILGNHDWLTGAEPIRRAMTELGWHDLGGKTQLVEHCGRTIALSGDERPWLGGAPPEAPRTAGLQIALSHTPDHFPTLHSNCPTLMFSGHNHGGQVCLPLIGPVYSPSLYGVRYAAGSFRQGNAVLHVGRGLSAERPLRLNCRPELTKVVLKVSGERGQ